MARPSEYDNNRHPIIALAMTRLGATDEQLSVALGISVASLNLWKKRYPEFLEALKEGKALADAHVEVSLYRRALGYEYTEKKMVQEAKRGKNGRSYMRVVRTETITKQVLPDTTAQIFWLKNRKPEEWRDLQQRELTGKGGEAIAVKAEGLAAQLAGAIALMVKDGKLDLPALEQLRDQIAGGNGKA